MGRAALEVTLSVGDVHTLEQQEVLAKHSSLFTEKLGCLKRDGSEVEYQL